VSMCRLCVGISSLLLCFDFLHYFGVEILSQLHQVHIKNFSAPVLSGFELTDLKLFMSTSDYGGCAVWGLRARPVMATWPTGGRSHLEVLVRSEWDWRRSILA